MKYIIRRSSMWDKRKPCEGAVQEEVSSWEIRTCSKTELMNIEEDAGEYEDVLTDNATWCRKRIKETVWTMDIEDLQKFAQEVDCKIIVFPQRENDIYEIPVVEIYDDWRE